jgi:hypothetical protein
VIGDTVFVRREKSPTQVIKDVRGYGHTFPENYTSWDAETRGSISPQRIIFDMGKYCHSHTYKLQLLLQGDPVPRTQLGEQLSKAQWLEGYAMRNIDIQQEAPCCRSDALEVSTK